MPDREKVIKGLENTEIMLKQAVDRGGEMAVMGAFKCYNHVSDALALLKEQEAVVPITEHHLFLCPVCKKTLFREQKFCHECGKHIEWKGR